MGSSGMGSIAEHFDSVNRAALRRKAFHHVEEIVREKLKRKFGLRFDIINKLGSIDSVIICFPNRYKVPEARKMERMVMHYKHICKLAGINYSQTMFPSYEENK